MQAPLSFCLRDSATHRLAPSAPKFGILQSSSADGFIRFHLLHGKLLSYYSTPFFKLQPFFRIFLQTFHQNLFSSFFSTKAGAFFPRYLDKGGPSVL